MKLRFLQLIVFIAGCLGLFFICYPDCMGIFNKNECEKLHYRTSDYPRQIDLPLQSDTSRTYTLVDTVISI